jgi:hypothetical protein
LVPGSKTCEVAERQVFIADGKGRPPAAGQVSSRFFGAVAGYLDTERPAGADSDRVFVVLKGRNRGNPLSVRGHAATAPASTPGRSPRRTHSAGLPLAGRGARS